MTDYSVAPQRWAHGGRMMRMIRGEGSCETVRIQRRCSGPYRPQVQGLWVRLRSYNEFYHLLKPPSRAPERAIRAAPDVPLKRGERIQRGPPELSTETQRATTWEMHNLDSWAYQPLYGLSAGSLYSCCLPLLFSASFVFLSTMCLHPHLWTLPWFFLRCVLVCGGRPWHCTSPSDPFLNLMLYNWPSNTVI